jgi:hypothetical protein
MNDMENYVGNPPVRTEYAQIEDDVGKDRGYLHTCGWRQYTLDQSYRFLNFTQSYAQDDWNRFSLYTNDDRHVGTYVVHMTVTLPSFPMIAPAVSLFTIYVLKRPVNHLPYFSPKLPEQVNVDLVDPEMKITPWTFDLPPTRDDDKFDIVTLSHSFGIANNFVSLVDNYIEIKDIRKTNTTNVKPGYYPLFFYLSDGKNSSIYTLPLFINDPFNYTDSDVSMNMTMLDEFT